MLCFHTKQRPMLAAVASPITLRKSSITAHKSNTDHHLTGFPMRSLNKKSSQSSRQQGCSSPNPLTPRESSIDQIKSKLREYLRKTQQSSLLNYHNQSLPEFNHRTIHQHFRMTLFRSNLKKRINLHILDSSFAQRYQSSPEFNVSEALINPRKHKQLDNTEKLFHPKREYFIHHHQKRKEKIPIPKYQPLKIIHPLTDRESSYRERERGAVGVEPWRDSEQMDVIATEDA